MRSWFKLLVFHVLFFGFAAGAPVLVLVVLIFRCYCYCCSCCCYSYSVHLSHTHTLSFLFFFFHTPSLYPSSALFLSFPPVCVPAILCTVISFSFWMMETSACSPLMCMCVLCVHCTAYTSLPNRQASNRASTNSKPELWRTHCTLSVGFSCTYACACEQTSKSEKLTI